MVIDVLTVLKSGHVILEPVMQALRLQGDVTLNHYVVPGPLQLPHETRYSAIARARNKAKAFGSASLAMFLDRDIVLPPGGIEKLAWTLCAHPQYAAIGIDYQDEASYSRGVHVSMGAILIHRSMFDRVTFRVEGDRCECWSFCRDLRCMGYKVDYIPGLKATHLRAI